MKTKLKVREVEYICTSKRCGFSITVHTDASTEEELKKVKPIKCSACGRAIKKRRDDQ